MADTDSVLEKCCTDAAWMDTDKILLDKKPKQRFNGGTEGSGIGRMWEG